ncbi:MAG TPA: class I SAM-dependent methyltransferase [Ktedonobacterales bacterium]|nr:class I SAM-dependent methyltransferase [Ktedonobacterales bacterium]
MKIGVIAENPLERAALLAGLVPTPLAQTIVGMWLARTIMVGVKLGVFEALAQEPLTASEVGTRCRTEPHATEKLLIALVGAGYLRVAPPRRRASPNAMEHPSEECYALTPVTRRWLLATSPQSLRDAVLHQFLDAQFIEHYEEFVLTGRPLDVHAMMTPEQWGVYQRGMRSGANLYAPEVARRTPVPKGARAMLDIGGAHGYFSVALCRRYPELHATILDLPEAVEQAAPLLAREGMGERVIHKVGDAVTEDLGVERYDLVFISSLMHHFDEATNRALTQRAAQALCPGGYLVVQEVFRPVSAHAAGQLGALADLYFAVTSEAGTWSPAEIAAWQRAAGLAPRKPIEFLFAPGTGQQSARKPV